MGMIVEYLGKINEKEADAIALSESDKANGVWVLYPELGEEKEDCYIALEYDEDGLVWGRIYTVDELPENLRECAESCS